MLHLFCGKIASGKSTLAARIAEEEGGLLISEDAWLAALFADDLKTGADYLRCNARLRAALGPHLAALLERDLTVVLDFQANTRDVRGWMRGLVDATGTAHRLHLLDPPDAVCLARLQARNAAGSHDFAVTEEMFHRFSARLEPPTPDEGFEIVRHG